MPLCPAVPRVSAYQQEYKKKALQVGGICSVMQGRPREKYRHIHCFRNYSTFLLHVRWRLNFENFHTGFLMFKYIFISNTIKRYTDGFSFALSRSVCLFQAVGQILFLSFCSVRNNRGKSSKPESYHSGGNFRQIQLHRAKWLDSRCTESFSYENFYWYVYQ